MFDKVTGLKNILWAIGIVLCLLALFVGFIVSAVSPYHGESDPRTPDLNAVREKNSSADISAISFVEPDGELHQLRESKDAGAEYISSSVFLTDSVLLALREEALTGSDGLNQVSREEFTSGYRTLIDAILRVSPDTKIVCCSLSPVTADYDDPDNLDNDMIANANDWLRALCLETGVYFADTASALSAGGDLDPKYAAANNRSLNTAGALAVLNYLRTHAIPSV